MSSVHTSPGMHTKKRPQWALDLCKKRQEQDQIDKEADSARSATPSDQTAQPAQFSPCQAADQSPDTARTETSEPALAAESPSAARRRTLGEQAKGHARLAKCIEHLRVLAPLPPPSPSSPPLLPTSEAAIHMARLMTPDYGGYVDYGQVRLAEYIFLPSLATRILRPCVIVLVVAARGAIMAPVVMPWGSQMASSIGVAGMMDQIGVNVRWRPDIFSARNTRLYYLVFGLEENRLEHWWYARWSLVRYRLPVYMKHFVLGHTYVAGTNSVMVERGTVYAVDEVL